MTNRRLQDMAKDMLADYIQTAEYTVTGKDELSEKEQEILRVYIRKYGKKACDAIGRPYSNPEKE